MNLRKIHTSSTGERQTDERPGYFGKHLFTQLACTTTLDTVQVRVNPTDIRLCHCGRGCVLDLLVRAVDGNIEF